MPRAAAGAAALVGKEVLTARVLEEAAAWQINDIGLGEDEILGQQFMDLIGGDKQAQVTAH